jgi:CRP/FNR family cyclic AMP-dependent transcriptional regulator
MNNTVAATATSSVGQKKLEDPLAYLPCSTIVEYRKGQNIQSQGLPARGICLVLAGKVKVCRQAENGREVVIDIYRPDEFFGESVLLGLPRSAEVSVAIEDTKVITWTAEAIEEIATRTPQLALALMQLFVQRSIEFTSRIESFSTDNIARRLVRALIRFSERLGHLTEDGSVQSMPFTHELLSQYVGTSREIVTHYMNQFRSQGYVRYSRRGTMVYADALKEWLRQDNADKADGSLPKDGAGPDGDSDARAILSPAKARAAA